jgi:hypothetical protein
VRKTPVSASREIDETGTDETDLIVTGPVAYTERYLYPKNVNSGR